MKKYYKGILLVFCVVLSFSLIAPQSSNAGVPATALPMGDYSQGTVECVNNSGQYAGALIDNDDNFHACFWDSETHMPILLDQADDGVLDNGFWTDGIHINVSGEVVGFGLYDQDNYYERAFSWTSGGGMVDIGALYDGDGWTEPFGINDSGQILVRSNNNDIKNFLWSSGARTELTYTDPDTSIVYPIDFESGALNNSGQVAGRISGGSLNDSAVLWEDGTAKIITPGVTVGSVYINNDGQVAGSQDAEGQNPWIYTPGPDGGLRSIDVTGQYPDMSDGPIYVIGFNGQGQVLIFQPGPVIRAMVWQDDGSGGDLFTQIPLNCLIGPDRYDIYVHFLNELGQVVGRERNLDAERDRTFLWNPETPGGIAIMKPLDGMKRAGVYGMNETGVFVGQSYDASYTAFLPCMWQTNGITMTYPPVIDVSAAPVSGVSDSPITFTATAFDPDAGDTLTFSLEDAPYAATIDSATGEFNWTPEDAAGQFSFTIWVADSDNLFDKAEVTINVTTPPPALTLTVQSIDRKGKSVIVSVLIFNPTATDVTNVNVTAASLGGLDTVSRLPDNLRTIRAGAGKTCKLKFASDVVPAGEASFSAEGSCSLGGFSAVETVTVP